MQRGPARRTAYHTQPALIANKALFITRMYASTQLAQFDDSTAVDSYAEQQVAEKQNNERETNYSRGVRAAGPVFSATQHSAQAQVKRTSRAVPNKANGTERASNTISTQTAPTCSAHSTRTPHPSRTLHTGNPRIHTAHPTNQHGQLLPLGSKSVGVQHILPCM
jgi:hypothetical protein